MRAPEQTQGRPERPGLLAALAFAATCAWLLWRTGTRLLAAWRFSTDDAFITLRYARHLLAGEGLVWNLGGPRVEGYSNFLFVLAAALFEALGEPGVAPLKVLGCAGLFATMYLQWAIARRWLRPLPALIAPAVFSCTRGAIWWSVSGLETSVYAALVCAAMLAGLRGLGWERVEAGARGSTLAGRRGPKRRRALVVAGLLCLLASLLRPEGPLVFVALVLATVGQARADSGGHLRLAPEDRQLLLGLLAAFVPALVAYFAWRTIYFGQPLPNTVLCKAGYGGDRFVLLKAYAKTAPVVLVLALLQPPRSLLEARVLAPLGLAVAYGLALIGADPVVGHDIRHFLAAHALLCVLASVAAVRLVELLTRGGGPLREAAVLLAALVLAEPVFDLPEREQLERRARGYAGRSRTRAALGHYLDRQLGPGEAALLGDVGVVGWTTERPIVDSFCLNEPAWNRPPISGSSARFVDALLEDPPALIVVHSREPDAVVPRGQVYRELVAREAFTAGWEQVHRFESRRFNYLVFRPKR